MAPEHFERRRALARAQLSAFDADAWFVSHLPNVTWLTGFYGTAGAALLTADSLRLITDFRYAGAVELQRSRRELAPALDVTITDQSIDETVVAFAGDRGWEALAFESDHVPVRRYRRLQARLPKGTRLVDVEPVLERLRAIKDPGEQRLYRTAVSRLAEVASLLPSMLAPGRLERDIAADIDHALKKAGFQRPAFDTIVAGGPNSALPHARPTDRPVQRGEPLVLDFGGVYAGYSTDLTRTAFIGQPTKEFVRVFEAVAAAQQAAVAALRDGVRASEVDGAARQVLTERGLGEAFGHATGHGLGLDVHEYPRIGRQTPEAEDPVMRAGMIVTIEPGAYLADVGGVRIEDDVLVGPGGAEILTDIPRGLMAPGAR